MGKGGRFFVAGLLSLLGVTGLAAPSPDPRPILEMRSLRLARSLTLPLPTEMVAVEWDGRQPGAVELRSFDRGGWTDWRRVEGNPAEGPDAGSREDRARTTSAGPVWVGTAVRKLQIRVVEGRLRNARVHAIRTEDQAPAGAIAAADALPQPGIISRAQWGADESMRKCAPQYASTVRNSFVHHTDNANNYSASQSAALVRGIYAYHVQHNGWCDIGYNFLVDRYGQIFEGRAGGIDRAVIGAHAGGFNEGSTGIALIGTFQSAAVPGPMYDGLRKLLGWKLELHGVDPNAQTTVTAASFSGSRYPAGSHVTLWTISGHRDVDSTDCPGDVAEGLLGRLRTDVAFDTAAQHNPVGGFDGLSRSSLFNVRLTGWARDPDTTGPITVQVFADGRHVTDFSAGVNRADVGPHGFDGTIAVNFLQHPHVCVTAVNVGRGTGNIPLGCKDA